MRTFERVDGDLGSRVIDGLESVRQRVEIRLRWWIGTWFLQTEGGIPYLQDVFGRQPDERLAARVITDQILGVEDVTGVRDVRFRIDPDRTAHYSATVDTVFGEFSMLAEVA